MSTKFFKIISVGVLALALAVFTGGIANAVVTLNATTVSSDVALTLTGAATSVWSLSGAGAALTINSGGAAALTLDSGTTGAVNLATGASAKTITIGNNATTTSLALTSGTGSQTFTSSVATTGTASSAFVFSAGALTSGTGLYLSTTADTGTAQSIVANSLTTGTGLSVTSSGTMLTTGALLSLVADSATTAGVSAGDGLMRLSADGLTTGTGLDVTSTSAVLGAGELANFEHIASNVLLTAKTGQLVDITSSRTSTRLSGTTADDYDVASIIRTSVQNGASGTLTATGSALYVENVATQTAGTLTDSTKGIEVVMDVDGTGDGIEVTHNALTGVALDVISAANTGSGQVITANALTTGTGLRVISSGVIATTGELVEFTASGATDSTGVVRITTAGLTTGTALLVQTSTANFTTGAKAIEVDLVAALAGNGITVTTTGAYTGTGLNLITANGLTTGIAQAISSTSNVLTSGKLLSATWAPLLVTAISAGNLAQIVDSPTINATVAATHNDLNITRTNATTATVITYTPSGSLVKIVNASPTVGGGSTITDSAVVLDVQQNNATGTGNAFKVTDVKGAGTANIAVNIVANSLTTSTGALTVSANALISGTTLQLNGVEVTMTTGRYLSAYDGATEVFGIGANGHIHSTVSADPPTIAVTTQNGITAAAITSGGTDTAGIITTTGTNNNGGVSVLQVTFGKTYTTAPKTVLLFPRNSAASKAATTSYLGVFVSATSATTFDITIPADAAAAATPSWNYFVIQ